MFASMRVETIPLINGYPDILTYVQTKCFVLGVIFHVYDWYSTIRLDAHDQREVLRRLIDVRLVHDW